MDVRIRILDMNLNAFDNTYIYEVRKLEGYGGIEEPY